MSYQNYEKAIELAKQCNGYKNGGGKSTSVINKAEALLDMKFSRQCRKYFEELGYLEFFGVEIFGIVDDDFSGDPEANCVETALADRDEYSLPSGWLPIYFFDDGYYGYLDYEQLNNDGEPSVIVAIYDGEKYVVTEKVAEDLGDFILQLVEGQLSEQ